MESQIHHLEQVAYSSVLRAFLAQSDSISWDQLELITHLRRELKVSDEEHKELYARVKDDEIIQIIKEWRHGAQQSNPFAITPIVRDSAPYSAVSGPYKKQKTSQSGPLSFTTPALGLQSQSYSDAKHKEPSGTRGKRRKPGQPFNPLLHSSTGAMVNGRFMSRGSSEAASNDPLIGRKVLLRWPSDNNFYEAVIRSYNPYKGEHVVVYDIDTADETMENVNFNEIPPGDMRWVDEDPGISHQEGLGGRGLGVEKAMSNGGGSVGAFRSEKKSVGVQSKKEIPQSRRITDDIELVNTHTLIREVERIFSASNPDPHEVDKAKKMLREHEEALVDAITKLADASDGESEDEQTMSLDQSADRGDQRNTQNGGSQPYTSLNVVTNHAQTDCQDEYIEIE